MRINKQLFNEKAEEKGLTQGEIAEKIGVKRNWIVNFLSSRHLSQLKTVKNLCDLLGVKMDELIKDDKK